MKKLMLGLMVAFAVTAVMASVTIDGLKYDLNSQNKTATLTGCVGDPSEVNVSTIQSGNETYTVTSVGEYAFVYTSLTSVSLPNVTTIGNCAFDECSKLTEVSLPKVTSVGDDAFECCTSLTSVSLPNVTTIGNYAFYRCSSLTNASLSVATSIGKYAFDECSKLTEVSLPKVTSVGDDAFECCTSLTSVSLPNVTTIGNYAFYRCSSLTSFSLPEATSIGNYAFDGCSKLESVSLPKATTIGQRAFDGCSSLTNASLSVATSIGMYAFDECSSLKTVAVKNYAMKSALEGNRSYYRLGEGVTVINAAAVTVGDFSYEFDADNHTAIILGYKGSSGELDIATVEYQQESYVVATVGRYAFDNCGSLVGIALANVTSVGEGAFRSCSSLAKMSVTKQMKQTLEGNRSYYGIGDNVKIYYPPTLTEEQARAAQYDVKEADVKTEVAVTIITPASVTLKSGDEQIDEGEYENACLYYGLTPETNPGVPDPPTTDDFKVVSKDAPIVEPDEIAVKKESIAAPSAGTVTVEDNKVQLGVTVLKTSDLTAETKTWDKVKITKDNIDVDADGNIIVNVPVDSASGFMILQSKDAKIAPVGK